MGPCEFLLEPTVDFLFPLNKGYVCTVSFDGEICLYSRSSIVRRNRVLIFSGNWRIVFLGEYLWSIALLEWRKDFVCRCGYKEKSIDE